jgi:hypothetical protein
MPLKKVYPIGRYRGVARAVVAELVRNGFEVVHDWTEEKPDRSRSLIASDDIWAATHCDVVLMMWSDDMRGSWVEVGAALAHHIPVIVVGMEKREFCIFMEHVGVAHVPSLAEAIALMEKLNGKA